MKFQTHVLLACVLVFTMPADTKAAEPVVTVLSVISEANPLSADCTSVII